MDNQTDVSIRFKNSVTGEKKLEQYSQTLIKINSVLKGLNTGVTKDIEKSSTKTKDLSQNLDNISKKVDTAFNYTAIRNFSRAMSRLTETMASFVKKSFDYLENINLYQVAFDGNYESADRFINKMTEMYGLDESWLTNTVGIFKQLSNAMDVSTETGEKLSTLLTQMSLDISSLYNVDMERASSTLQSALAGQTKPIRGTTGADITQSTLQKTLDTLGIDKYIGDLSYAEKRLLIVISLTDQLNESIGDMGRTIESPSNQMRVLNSQWERLTRAVGNVFLPIVSKVLPYLNAIMMVLTDILNLVAGLMGYKVEDFDYFAGTSDSVLDLEDNLNAASDSAKKLKQGLRGFDKLNVITTPTSTSSSAGSGLDPKILNAFNDAYKKYQGMLDDVSMKATKIRDAIEDWLGFTDGSYKNLKLIGIALGLIAAYKIIKSIGTIIALSKKVNQLLGVGGLFTILKKLINPIKVLGAKDGLAYIFLSAKDAVTKFLPIAGGVVSSIAGIVGITKQADDAMNGMEVSTGETAKNVLELAGGGALIGSAFGPIGSIVGAITGGFVAWGTALFSTNAALDAMYQKVVDKNLFGELSISTEEWLNMFTAGGEKLSNYGEKLDELQSELSSLNSTFSKSSEAVDLYGYKFGLTAYKITDEDTKNMKSAIDDMCTSTSQMIEKNTEFSLSLWGDSFSKMSSLTKTEQKNILDAIYNGGQSQQKELSIAQSNITKTYDNAIKTRGYLTDEEYKYIETQLQKIRQLTQNEMSKNQANIEYFKNQAANNNLKLDKESYAKFNEALTSYQDEQQSLIEENYKILRNNAEQYNTDSLEDQKIYNALIKQADEQRAADEKELTEKIKGYQNSVYENLANDYEKIRYSSDELSIKTRETIEGIFKGINVDPSEIVSKFSTAGKKAADSFSKEFTRRTPKLVANVELDVKMNQKYGEAYIPGKITSISEFSSGGMPPVGQLFVMNEQGPELLAQIGGKSFVANQNQMMDIIDKKIGNSQQNQKPQVFNIYLDANHKLGSYTLNQLEEMAKTSGRPIELGY